MVPWSIDHSIVVNHPGSGRWELHGRTDTWNTLLHVHVHVYTLWAVRGVQLLGGVPHVHVEQMSQARSVPFLVIVVFVRAGKWCSVL